MILRQIADLTPEWLAQALGTPVDEVATKPVGTGQTGESHRVRHRAAGRPDGSLVVKLAAGNADQRALVAPGFAWEVGFYRDLAGRLAVRTPVCHHADLSEDGLDFTLLLEDLSPAEPGRQADGCSVPQARTALRNLAGLHGPLWNDPLLKDLDWLQQPDDDFAVMLTAVHQDATPKFLERFGDDLPPEDAEVLTAAATLTERWVRERQEPFAVIHGDHRLDNLMFFPDGEVAALDWQTVMVGQPLRDVAYFLSLSLPAEVRREHERGLLADYHRALQTHGARGYSFEDCLEDYRVGMLQGPLITVLGCVYSPAERTREADAMFLSMVARCCAAIRDLGTLRAVGA